MTFYAFIWPFKVNNLHKRSLKQEVIDEFVRRVGLDMVIN